MNDGLLIKIGEQFLAYVDLATVEVTSEQSTTWKEGICVNCGHRPSVDAKLYCSEACRQEAKFIRFTRKERSEGRINQSDIRIAIAIKLTHAMNGSYDAKAREVPEALRELIYARDKRTCQMCGDPSNEIDHIRGNANTLENLQVLCRSCNQRKMEMGLIPLEATSDRDAQFEGFVTRVAAKTPLGLCDDEVNWESLEKDLRKQRREKVECCGCGYPVQKYAAQAVTIIEKQDGDDDEIELTEYYCQQCQDAAGEDDFYGYTAQGTPIEEF